jgi:hypothetical protein
MTRSRVLSGTARIERKRSPRTDANALKRVSSWASTVHDRRPGRRDFFRDAVGNLPFAVFEGFVIEIAGEGDVPISGRVAEEDEAALGAGHVDRRVEDQREEFVGVSRRIEGSRDFDQAPTRRDRRTGGCGRRPGTGGLERRVRRFEAAVVAVRPAQVRERGVEGRLRRNRVGVGEGFGGGALFDTQSGAFGVDSVADREPGLADRNVVHARAVRRSEVDHLPTVAERVDAEVGLGQAGQPEAALRSAADETANPESSATARREAVVFDDEDGHPSIVSKRAAFSPERACRNPISPRRLSWRTQ